MNFNKVRQRDVKTSALLQFFRACLRRYKQMKVSAAIGLILLLAGGGASASQLEQCGEKTTDIARQFIANIHEKRISNITLNEYQWEYVRFNDFRYPCRVMVGPGHTWNAEVNKQGSELLLSKIAGPEFKLTYYGPFPYAYNK